MCQISIFGLSKGDASTAIYNSEVPCRYPGVMIAVCLCAHLAEPLEAALTDLC